MLILSLTQQDANQFGARAISKEGFHGNLHPPLDQAIPVFNQ